MSEDARESKLADPVRASGVDPRLLELLICPLTRQPLAYDKARGELVSKKAGLAYPIRDGLVLMTEADARKFDPDAP
ncbi:MAG: Trm112 family protein [Hyphomonadaceae bacterium]|nr:Trm112 family protein [Hyphomonadaceae bacterium]